MEGFVEAVASFGHRFGADGDADVDAAGDDLVGDILDSFEAGGAEAVYGAGGCGGGVAGCEGGGAGYIGCFAVGDLSVL